jgi:hypothetical protein
MTKEEALKMEILEESLNMAIMALENIAFEYGQLLDGDQDYGLLPSETNEDIVNAYRTARLCEKALKEFNT